MSIMMALRQGSAWGACCLKTDNYFLNMMRPLLGEGKNPTKEHLLNLAGIGNIKQEKALEIIHQVLAATEKWHEFASETGVSKLQIKNIGDALSLIRKNVGI